MKSHRSITVSVRRRRGSVIAWTALSMVFIGAFAAMTIDLGYIHIVRIQLQTAADAAALAGVSALADPAFLFGSASEADAEDEAQTRAIDYAAKNEVFGASIQLELSDISVGFADPLDLDPRFVPGGNPYNAVHVLIRKDADSANGPIDLFFARMLGKETTSSYAEAIAYFDQRAIGFRAGPTGGPLIPISVRQARWQDEIVAKNGDDEYGFDPQTGQIIHQPDGIPEISIYPEKQKGHGGDPSDGAGNFGLLNFENQGNGAPALAQQIRDGLTGEEIARVFGQDVVRFCDDDGDPVEQPIDGNPGLKASLQDDLETRLGGVVGFFIHTEVTGSGANAVFTVVNVQFGRVLKVDLHGSCQSKAVVIQPEVYTGPEILTQEGIPTHATTGRFKLIQ